MNIKEMINIVLESNGGLNLYAKEVRDKIISEITERVCLDEGYENVFGKEECENIKEAVAERNERIIAQNKSTVESEITPDVDDLPKTKKEKNVYRPKKARRIKRKKGKDISQFTR